MGLWATKTEPARAEQTAPAGPLGGARELSACAQTLAGALEGGDEASMSVLAEADLPVHDAFTATLPALEATVIDSGVPATGVQALTRDGADGDRDGADGDRDGADGDRDGAKILLTLVPLRTPEGDVRGVVGVGATSPA